MIDPITAIGLAQTGIGAIGMALDKRPKYKIPDAVNQKLALAQANAASDMGGYNQAISNVGANAANATVAARESGNPLAVIGQIQANQNAGTNNIDAQNAQFKIGQQANLQNAYGEYANYQDQAFQINEFQPYADRQRMFNNMIGAGAKNAIAGIDAAKQKSIFNQILAAQQEKAIGTGFQKDAQLKGINDFLNSNDFQQKLKNQSIFDLPTRKYSGYGMGAPIIIGT